VSGIGNVLVDSAGMALYNPNREPNTSKILCTAKAGCTSFWKPLLISSGKPVGSGNVGKLGTFKNPEGGIQITVNGRPVYTFVSDSAGKVTGNNYQDHFNGTSFHWHALVAGGRAASAATESSGSSSSYGGGSGNGY
jgi:predicted lipoprotein with Yx(FWY)xxD motif